MQIKTFKLIPVIVFLLLLGFKNQIKAQNITIEDVKKICSNIDREDRIKVSVARFSSQMRTGDYNELGSELAAMLTNALFEVNCFRVLESASNLDDFNTEYDLSASGYTNNSGSSKGNMLGAQAIITGEITEYGEGLKTTNALGIGLAKRKAHIGFIIKVLDVRTRDLLFAKSINMTAKTKGFKGLTIVGAKVAGTTDRSKSLNNAVEQAIIKAAELLALSKDNWGIESNQDVLNDNKFINIVVSGIGFGEVVSFASRLSAIDNIKNVEKAFKDGVGSYQVVTSLNGEDLAFAILEAVGSKYEITEVNEGFVSLKKN